MKRSAIFLAAAAIAGIVLFIALIPRYSILYSIDSRLDRGPAIDFSRQIAAKIGEPLPSGLMQNTTFSAEGVSLAYSRSKVGTYRTNEAVRSDSLPLNYWDVLWFDPAKQSVNGTMFEAEISAGGKLTEYRRFVPDTASGIVLQGNVALANFSKFWKDHDLSRLTGVSLSRLKLSASEPVVLEHRQDWSLTFSNDSTAIPGLKEELKARLDGNEVTSLDIRYRPPEQFRIDYAAKSYPYVFLTFISWIAMFLFFAVGLVIFLKRYNEGEAGIGSSLFVSIAFYVTSAIAMALSFPSLGKGLGIGTMNIFYLTLIVSGIIDGHEGFLDVSSEQGVGTSFTIYIPAKSSEQITEASDNSQ